MERFRPALRRLAAELDLPRRARSELLLEIAADLHAVYEHHRARGLSEDEAARRAEAMVLASSEVIRRLGRLHSRPWRGGVEVLGVRVRGGLDLTLLLAGVVPAFAMAVGASVWSLAAHPSPPAWAVLAVGALMATIAVKEASRLLDRRPPLRSSLPSLLVLSAMAPALGLLASILGVQRMVIGLGGRGMGAADLLVAAAPDLATLLAGLLVGIVGLLLWFLLLELGARRAADEVDALLGEDVPGPVLSDAVGTSGTVIPIATRRQG